jgi:hypothetical protein
MKQIVEFEPNVPVQVALAFGDGKIVEGRSGSRVMYSLVGEKVMFLDPDVGRKIDQLGVKARQPFCICKGQTGRKSDGIEWRVWIQDGIGELGDGTFAVPRQAGADARTPAPVRAAQEPSRQVAQPTHNGNGNRNGGQGDGRGALEDALKTVISAVHGAQEHAKAIGFACPQFTSEDLVTMANTLMMQNGSGK